MNYKIYFETLGCSKNQVDTEIMMGLVSENSYILTADETAADIIVVNTCGFIESAKEESVNTILNLLEYKNQGQCKVLIVTGCLSERYSEELKKEIPEIDAFIGTTKFEDIVKVIEAILEEKGTVIDTGDIDKELSENLPRIMISPEYTGFLKIAEGCDNFCTYCIIPKLRGKYRSRKMEDILTEARNMVAQGVKEIIVIAQDTTRYGIDLYGEYKLAELLEELNKLEDLKWIRLQYLYPDVIDETLIDAIARLDKVVKYIDMPIQHASNSVLKRMNRTTDKESIQSIIKMLREKVEGVALRTTLIVGFPGETEEEFNELAEFVEEMKFNKLGVFAYSMEEDTAAARMAGQIQEDIKEERKMKIMEIQQRVSMGITNEYIGNSLHVLIEEKVEGEEVYIGRAYFDSPEIDGIVYVYTDKTLKPGDFVDVKINDALEYDLIGAM